MTQTPIKVPLKNIIVKPDRGRKIFKDIGELSESIKKFNGVIEPLVVTPALNRPGFYELICGERRYRAAILASLTEIEVTIRTNITEVEMKEMELEENVQRSNLEWIEQGRIIQQIYEIKQRKSETPLKDTATVSGFSEGRISQKLALAKKVQERPDLVEKFGHLPENAFKKQVELTEQNEKFARLVSSGHVTVTSDLRKGDCRDLIKTIPDASVGLWLTDPPFGVEKINALIESNQSDKMLGYSLMSKSHNLDLATVITLLEQLGPEIFRVLKPGAHAYVFTAAQYAGDFIRALEPHLEFQPPMLVWDRGKPSYPAYGYNYISRTETIIFFHRPPRSRRLAENKYNVLAHPDVPRDLRIYPTEKPTSLLKELILQSTSPGDVVLDTFAGSASTLVAAKETGRKGIGFEKEHDAWLGAMRRLNET